MAKNGCENDMKSYMSKNGFDFLVIWILQQGHKNKFSTCNTRVTKS
jgi:hypothetical protein